MAETNRDKLFRAMIDAAYLEGYLRTAKPDIHDRAERVAKVLLDLCLEGRDA